MFVAFGQTVPVTGVIGTTDLGAAVVRIPKKVIVTGVTAVGYISTINMWGLVNTTQAPNWGAINDAQNPNWGAVNDAQTPNWTNVIAA